MDNYSYNFDRLPSFTFNSPAVGTPYYPNCAIPSQAFVPSPVPVPPTNNIFCGSVNRNLSTGLLTPQNRIWSFTNEIPSLERPPQTGPVRVDYGIRRKQRSSKPSQKSLPQAIIPRSTEIDVSENSIKPMSRRLAPIPGDESQFLTTVCRVKSCGALCLGKEEFIQHLEDEHKIASKHNNDYNCTEDLCFHIANGKEALIKHVRAMHKRDIRADDITQPPIRVFCPWSGCKKTLTVSSLHRHITTHVKITFRCPICPEAKSKRCSRMSEYRKHFTDKHPELLQEGKFRYIEELIGFSNDVQFLQLG